MSDIKGILKTQLWRDLEGMFDAEINSLKDTSKIDPTLPDNTYAREVRARTLAAETLKKFLNKVKMAGKDKTTETKPTLIR